MDGLRALRADLASAAERVPVRALLPADSPRVDGENMDHARLLADIETELPPIVVHRPTMRVVDGMHRLRAAVLRGEEFIDVLYFDGSDADAFVLAVELNRGHGLPLSQADRTAAAARIIASHPEWSNRRIAAVTGMSATTVGAIRRRSTDQSGQLEIRVGRDGRARPNDGARRRERAGEFIMRNPGASLREIAKAAGVSPTTASDVRARLARGETAIPRQRPPLTQVNSRERLVGMDPSDVVTNLKRDPSLRFTNAGRALLRLLDACAIESAQWDEITDSVPSHQREAVAQLAKACAESWATFANRLARQRSESSSHGPRTA